MCHYKIVKQNVSENQLSEFMYVYFHLYGRYIKVYVCVLEKLRTFVLILKK
jgi:hypothetical protein